MLPDTSRQHLKKVRVGVDESGHQDEPAAIDNVPVVDWWELRPVAYARYPAVLD